MEDLWPRFAAGFDDGLVGVSQLTFTAGAAQSGGAGAETGGVSSPATVRAGAANLKRHLENLGKFGVKPVVAIHRFIKDTDAELDAVREIAAEFDTEAVVCTHWADGSAGTEELARKVVAVVEGINQPQVSVPGRPPQPVSGHLVGIRGADGALALGREA